MSTLHLTLLLAVKHIVNSLFKLRRLAVYILNKYFFSNYFSLFNREINTKIMQRNLL